MQCILCGTKATGLPAGGVVCCGQTKPGRFASLSYQVPNAGQAPTRQAPTHLRHRPSRQPLHLCIFHRNIVCHTLESGTGLFRSPAQPFESPWRRRAPIHSYHRKGALSCTLCCIRSCSSPSPTTLRDIPFESKQGRLSVRYLASKMVEK